MLVSTHMTPHPVTLTFNQSAAVAWMKLRAYQLHVLPVVQDDQVIGLVKLQDLEDFVTRKYGSSIYTSQASEHLMNGLMVEDVMRPVLCKVHPEESLQRVAQLMLEHHILGLPVVEGVAHLVGVVTVTNVLTALAGLPVPDPPAVLEGK